MTCYITEYSTEIIFQITEADVHRALRMSVRIIVIAICSTVQIFLARNFILTRSIILSNNLPILAGLLGPRLSGLCTKSLSLRVRQIVEAQAILPSQYVVLITRLPQPLF